MPTYLVRGADRDTGASRLLELDAPCESDAELLAQNRGMLVSRVMIKTAADEMKREFVALGAAVRTVAAGPGLPEAAPGSPAAVPSIPAPVRPASGARPLSRSRVTLAACAAVGMAATFLPWVHAPIIGPVPGTRGDGWLTFVAFAIVLAVATSPTPRAPFRWGRRALCAALGAGCAALGAWKVLDLADVVARQELEGGLAASLANATSVGAGLWLVLICGVVSAAAAVVLRDGAGA